jgi:hypothetical protein
MIGIVVGSVEVESDLLSAVATFTFCRGCDWSSY